MERTYIIPLRREWLKAPMYKRTGKAVKATRAFLQKHMKMERVKLGRFLNMHIWTNGKSNPPHKIEVSAEVMKDDDGDFVYAEMVGVKKESLKPVLEEKKKEEKIEEVKEESQKEKEAEEKQKVLKEVALEKEQPKPIAEEHHKHHNKEEAEKDREKYIYTKETRKERHSK